MPVNCKTILNLILLQSQVSCCEKHIPGITSTVSQLDAGSAGNKNLTPTALVSLPAFVFLLSSVSLAGLPVMAINPTDCKGFLNVCGVAWSRRLRSCCSKDSKDDEPDVDLPGVVTMDFSGDRLLMSVEVTPLTSVKSGSSVIPVSLSESLCNNIHMIMDYNLYRLPQN